jgi:[acyl-carrier-protein] S-malonyltransferase
MSRAFVFPGQGAQTIGMGRDLAEAYPAAKAVFDEVDAALGEKLSALIWEGDQDELTLTRNAQPALMATSMAAMAALKAEGVGHRGCGLRRGPFAGRIFRACRRGALTVTDAARLLRKRGEAMQRAVAPGEGAMAAILGLGLDEVRAVAAEAAGRDVVEAANDNDPAQVVISGHARASPARSRSRRRRAPSAP